MTQNSMQLGKVAVLMGGASAEREISLLSGAGVLKALLSQGVDAHAFDPAERDIVNSSAMVFRAVSLPCTAALEKTAPCRVRWNYWVFLTPVRV